MDSVAIQSLLFLPCFASFLHLMGSSRGFEVWHLGGLLVSWVGSFLVALGFVPCL